MVLEHHLVSNQIATRDFTSTEEKITSYRYPQGMPDYLSEINKNRPLINDEVIYCQAKQNDILV
jgi:DNA gyrase/topoisomerase IV subunit B